MSRGRARPVGGERILLLLLDAHGLSVLFCLSLLCYLVGVVPFSLGWAAPLPSVWHCGGRGCRIPVPVCWGAVSDCSQWRLRGQKGLRIGRNKYGIARSVASERVGSQEVRSRGGYGSPVDLQPGSVV